MCAVVGKVARDFINNRMEELVAIIEGAQPATATAAARGPRHRDSKSPARATHQEEEEESTTSRVKARRARRNDRMVQEGEEEGGEEGEDRERGAGKAPDERSNAAWTRYQYVVAAKNRKLELLDRLIEELGLSG